MTWRETGAERFIQVPGIARGSIQHHNPGPNRRPPGTTAAITIGRHMCGKGPTRATVVHQREQRKQLLAVVPADK